MTGGIPAREARDVVVDVLREHGVPDGIWSIRKGTLPVLVGARTVAVPLPRGLTFYAMQATVAKVEAVCRDLERVKAHRGQIDLEDAIAEARP